MKNLQDVCNRLSVILILLSFVIGTLSPSQVKILLVLNPLNASAGLKTFYFYLGY